MTGTDGMDGLGRLDGVERADRRQGGGQAWGQQWPQSQDPSQGASQALDGTQDHGAPWTASPSNPTDGQAPNLPDPREIPVVPGRFLRNTPPERQAAPEWPAPPQFAAPGDAPQGVGQGETPTRSIPVLSRSGASLEAGTSVRQPGVERAAGTPGSGLGNGVGAGSALPPQGVPQHGAYIAEETQELLMPGRPGAGSTASPPASAGEQSAPRPSVLNAANAAAAAYREPGETGGMSAVMGGTQGQMAGGEEATRGGQPWMRPGRWQVPGGAAGAAGAGAGVGATGGNQPQAQQSFPQQSFPQQPVAQRPARAAVPPYAGPSHVGWHAAENWGTVSITMSANTAAGFAYLFGWLSGTFFYFGERQNRYVRFHAMQSILLTVPFTILGILLYVLVNVVLAKQLDLVTTALWLTFAVLLALAMLGIWLWTMAAAWGGHYLRLPIIGNRAEYFSAPPQDPYAMDAAQ